MRKKSGMSVAACILWAGSAAAQEIPAPPEFAGVRAHIRQGIEKGLAPSLALAVIRDGKVVWAEGFGHADVERKIKATPDSIYRLASLSKQLTATGVMILHDRGALDVDSPVNDYLPGPKLRAFAGSAEKITIRQLASHTSGLPTHWNWFYDGVAPPSMDETIRRYGFAATEPGSEWVYSNVAFGILGYLTEVASKTSWREFMERNLYDPLGMNRTSDRVRPGREDDTAPPYWRDAAGNFVRTGLYTSDHPGASVVRSSANDLARFVRMHLNGGILDGVRILKKSSVREMRGPEDGYGIGWMVQTGFGRRCLWQWGGMMGVATRVRVYPADKVAAIVLTNTQKRELCDGATRRIEAVLFPDPVKKPPARRRSSSKSEPADFQGTWKGRLVHPDGDIPVTLEVGGKDDLQITIGEVKQAAKGVEVRGNRLKGRIEARIRTRDGYHGTPTLEFRLRRSGDRLIGTGFARAPGYFGLSHWVELRREKKTLK